MRLVSFALVFSSVCAFAAAPDWSRFRGPNGAGTIDAKGMPEEVGKDKNVLWRIDLKPGFSSPVLGNKCVYVSSHADNKKAYAACIDRQTGKLLWEKELFENTKPFPKVNTIVSSTPVTDGKNVYFFFEHLGLIGLDENGAELWRVPMEGFTNPYGMANSPILVGSKVILQADQDLGAFLLAVDAKTGKQLWKVERPDVQHSYSTPIVYKPKSGPEQLIVSAPYKLVGYSTANGERLWWVDGMAWQAKSTPIVSGDMLYVHSWMAGISEIAKVPATMSFEDFVKQNDKDGDGKVVASEAPDKSMAQLWFLFDLNRNKSLDQPEWEVAQNRDKAQNGLYAIKLGGSGNITSNVVFKIEKSLPNIPSPLLYRDVLYVLKEGGILSAYNAKTGDVLKQARIEGALEGYFASPVAADGKIYTISQPGKLAVIKAGADWQLLSLADLGEEGWATPAIDDSGLYVRTQKALYKFGTAKK